ncbi:MAG: hypothetical protein JWL84_6402 [Rhodospirillales bacterium]|jgi:hypothetical protein|nr:hypothetical protein [Rhodospirillales bacterium]
MRYAQEVPPVTYNLFLKPIDPTTKGGELTIEHPATATNVVWQTRPAPLTDEENALADSLMAIFVKGAWELSDVVAALNEMGPPPVAGGAWTEKSLAATLARFDLEEGR